MLFLLFILLCENHTQENTPVIETVITADEYRNMISA